eukprot:UN04510
MKNDGQSAFVTWKCNPPANDPKTRGWYEVSTDPVTRKVQVRNHTECLLRKLDPKIKYKFIVHAVNEFGHSAKEEWDDSNKRRSQCYYDEYDR